MEDICGSHDSKLLYNCFFLQRSFIRLYVCYFCFPECGTGRSVLGDTQHDSHNTFCRAVLPEATLWCLWDRHPNAQQLNLARIVGSFCCLTAVIIDKVSFQKKTYWIQFVQFFAHFFYSWHCRSQRVIFSCKRSICPLFPADSSFHPIPLVKQN